MKVNSPKVEKNLNQVIVVRYGELFLKGKNKSFFIQILTNNIKRAFSANNFTDFQIKKFSDQLLISSKNTAELPSLLPLLNHIFGISVFFLSYQLESSLEKLNQVAENLTNYYEINFTSFKLDVSRSEKNFPQNSLFLQHYLGGIIRQKYNLKVDLNSPQKIFYLRIYRSFILFYNEKGTGWGGLPVGSSGKVLLLLSGGIDSPVAAYQLMKRGLEVSYLHFYYQKTGQEKILALVEKLKPYNNFINGTPFLVDFQPFLSEIRHISQTKYRLIILKRMFIRFANLLAHKLQIKALATGDSLAQVSSQTLESLKVIQQAGSSALLFGPLLTGNKIEIIAEARKIGTYSLSLQNYSDCCALFEPPHPITYPRLEVIEKLEAEIFGKEVLESVYKKSMSGHS